MYAEQMRLDGKTALVTGAGKGLARAICIGLAEAGADIAAVTRSAADLKSLGQEVEALGCRFVPIRADITRSDAVDAAVATAIAELGGIDILVNGVGRSFRKPVVETTDAEWDAAILSNLTSTFYTCRAVGVHMLSRKSGVVINIASTAGTRGRPGIASYSAAKAAIINFSRALAVEWSEAGVRVNVLCPGRFLTPATAPDMTDTEKLAAFSFAMCLSAGSASPTR